jgi:hypothetical protein
MTTSIDTKYRQYIVKKVRNPDDDSQYVLVPCVKRIELGDAKSYAQEHRFIFENTNNNTSRKVRVADVQSKNGDGHLKVERILKFGVSDAKSYAQEYKFILNNDDEQALLDDKGGTGGPHKKTHIRYWASPPDAVEKTDGGAPDPTQEPTGADAWIKMEVIDQFSVTDNKSYAQEYVYTITQPIDGSDIPKEEDAPPDDSDDEKLFSPPKDDDTAGWKFDPFQNPIDVQWTANDFVVHGSYQTNTDVFNPVRKNFLTVSHDGLTWREITPYHNPGVYGKGVWTTGNSKSTDLFKTWKSVDGDTPDIFALGVGACYGMPVDAKLTDDPLIIKNGIFAALSSPDRTHLKIYISKDLSDSWQVVKTINTDGVFSQWTPLFINCIQGVFYACVFGNAPNTSSFPNILPANAFEGICKLYTSRNGIDWDDGTEILQGITKATFDDELFHIPVYPSVNVFKMVYKKKSKTFVISGCAGYANTVMFYAEASDPKLFNGVNKFGEFGQTSTDEIIIDQATGDEIAHITAIDNFINPSYYGGWPACIGDKVAISLAKLEQEINLTLISNPPVHFATMPELFNNYHVDTTSDQEGVLDVNNSEGYFCGGIVSHNAEVVAESFFTDPNPPHAQFVHYNAYFLPIPGPEGNFRPGQPPQIEVNGFKDKDNTQAIGTFLYKRQLAVYTQYNDAEGGGTEGGPDLRAALVTQGFQLWRSEDGVTFTKITTHPYADKLNGFAGIVMGKIPPPPKDT